MRTPPPTATMPPTLRVTADLDGVHVALPRRIHSHRRLQAAAVAAAMAAAGLALAAAQAAQLGANIAVIAAAIFVAGLLPYGVLLAGRRRLAVARQVTLTGARLQIDRLDLPLEDIAQATVAGTPRHGRLVLATRDGARPVLAGLRAGELRWLAALIGAHAARRRAAVGAGEGAAAVPASLSALLAQAPPGG